MNTHKEQGAALEILIIGIAIIVAMGLIAWRYIEADKAQNDAELSLASQSISAPPNTTLPLREIGFKIRVTSSMTQTFGTLTATKVDSGYEIRSQKLANSDWSCAGENTGLLGVIKRSEGATGEASYDFEGTGQVSCYVGDVGTKLIADFDAILPRVLQPTE